MELFKVVVQAAIICQGRILLMKRFENDEYLPLYWETPGGTVEEGETLEKACEREVKEETGIMIKVENAFHAFEYSTKEHRCICIHYLANRLRIKGVRLSEHAEYCWASRSDVRYIKLTKEMRSAILSGFENYKWFSKNE